MSLIIPSAGNSLASIINSESWRLTPATMAMRLSQGHWIPAKHLLYISAIIAAELRKGNARIIVSMPPRHGKSELLSVHTPPWIFDHNPSHRVMLTSYGADLATDFSVRTRDLIIENQDILRVKLHPDRQRANAFSTTSGGALYAAGVGGPITGRGANALLVDDYIKNAKDAASQTIRDDGWEWITSTAMTRLEPGGSVIILATRWNIDDIIGRFLIRSPDRWIIIRLPALAEANDPLGRQIGEPLWPERYDREALEETRAVLGTYYWEALYQQKPIPRSALMEYGNIVVVDIVPNVRLRKVRAWDLAASPEKGDWAVGALLGEDDTLGLTFILDIIRVQVGPATIENLMFETAKNDGGDTEIAIEQEPGSGGKSYVDYLRRTVLRGFSVTNYPAQADKFVRAQPLLGAIQGGTVRARRANWNKDLIDEFQLFPDGPHDDQVDACSTGFIHLHREVRRGVTFGRKTADGKPISTGRSARVKTAPAEVTKRVFGPVFGRSRMS
jgi:predicted phage terminase large subunit-like protein